MLSVDPCSITAKYVRSILDYDPKTGVFAWKVRPLEHFVSETVCKRWNNRYAGKNAGSVHPLGYVVVTINKIRCRAHRLAILYMKGYWPEHEVDHLDMDRSNNKFDNLREADRQQNSRNKVRYENNKTGLKGVMFHKQNKKFYSQIGLGGKLKYLGTFDCPAAASFAYQLAADRHFGEFARPF